MKILYCENGVGKIDAALPAVTLLTDSALSRNRLPLFLPPHSSEWLMTFGFAIRIVRLGKYISARFAPRYYDAVTLVARLRPVNAPTPASACFTAFDSAAVIGDWQPVGSGSLDLQDTTLSIAGSVNEQINVDVERLNATVETLSRYFTLRTGDIIVAGDLESTYIPIINNTLHLTLNDVECLNFKIK